MYELYFQEIYGFGGLRCCLKYLSLTLNMLFCRFRAAAARGIRAAGGSGGDASAAHHGAERGAQKARQIQTDYEVSR